MGTIKEERDALLARKLKEMGEMGSSPHTLDNSPFFDPPNELFFMEEEAKDEHQKQKGQKSENRDFTSDDVPEEELSEVLSQNAKPKKSTTVKQSQAKQRASFTEYQQRFLAPNVFELRTQFTVNKETTDLMKIILQDLGSKTTLTAYIENILRDHISEYRELINQVTAKRRRKETIPE